jgi:hypothetical protein
MQPQRKGSIINVGTVAAINRALPFEDASYGWAVLHCAVNTMQLCMKWLFDCADVEQLADPSVRVTKRSVSKFALRGMTEVLDSGLALHDSKSECALHYAQQSSDLHKTLCHLCLGGSLSPGCVFHPCQHHLTNSHSRLGAHASGVSRSGLCMSAGRLTPACFYHCSP